MHADHHKAFMVAAGSDVLDTYVQIRIGRLLDRVGAQVPFALGLD
jgi:hypothetical protein